MKIWKNMLFKIILKVLTYFSASGPQENFWKIVVVQEPYNEIWSFQINFDHCLLNNFIVILYTEIWILLDHYEICFIHEMNFNFIV